MANPVAVLNILVEANTGQATASLTRLEGQLQGTASRSRRSAQAINTAMKYAAVGAAGAAAASVKLAADFDKSMRNVNSIAGLPEAKFKALEKQVLKLAGPTAQAPKTLAEGLYDLVSSGFDAKESMTILRASAKAATAGLTDTKTSTKAVAAALNAYRRPASDAKAVSDDLFQTVNLGVISFEDLAQNIGDVLPFAAALKVDTKQVGAAISTMTKEGLSGAEATTRLKNVLVAFTKPSEALTNQLHQMGFESGQQIIQQKGLEGALIAVTDAVGNNQAEVGKLFPNIRALGGALALTGENAKNAQRDLAGFKNDAGATNKVFAEQSKSVALQFNRLKAQVEVLAINFGSKLLPAISDTMKMLSNPKLSGEQKFNKLMERIGQAISKAIPTIAEHVAKAVPKVAEAFVHGFLAADIWGKLAIAAFIVKKLGIGSSLFSSAGGRAATNYGKGFRSKLKGFAGTLKGIGYTVIGVSLLQGAQAALEQKGGEMLKGKAFVESLPGGSAVEGLLGIKSISDSQKINASLALAAINGKRASDSLGRYAKTSEDLRRIQRDVIPQLVKENKITAEQAQVLAQAAKSRGDDLLARERFQQNLTGGLKSGLLTSLKDIQTAMDRGIALIGQSGFKRGGKQWRRAMGQNMQGAIDAVRMGMASGAISAEQGMKRIRELVRQRLIITGSDPFRLAKGFADSWQKAGKVNDAQVQKAIKALAKMPPAAREKAQNAMVQMAQALENKGQLVRGSADRLRSALVAKFGATGEQSVTALAKGLSGLGSVFSSLSGALTGALGDIGTKVSSFLKSMGVKAGFHVAKAAGSTVSNLFDGLLHFGHHARGGMLGGSGKRDTVPIMAAPGEAILNRHQQPHVERAMAVTKAMGMGRYGSLGELFAGEQTPHYMASGGMVDPYRIQGPRGALRSYGQAGLDKSWAAARAYVKKHRPKTKSGVYHGPLNRVFPHPGGPQISFNAAAYLAEKAGLPGVTYAQIAIGESGLRPGAVSSDGGYGLWQMTPRVQSAATVAKWNALGSYFNPWTNAQMAKVLAGGGTGTSNYFGTGSVTDWNKHYRGPKPQGAARGGFVNPLKMAKGGYAWRGAYSPAGLHSGIQHFAGYLMSRFPGLEVNSTTGGNHVSGSLHYSGHAVDLGPDTSLLEKVSGFINTSGLYKLLTEGIHNPNLAVADGHHVSGPSYYSSVWAGHRDHIHLGMTHPWTVPGWLSRGGAGGAADTGPSQAALKRRRQAKLSRARIARRQKTLAGLQKALRRAGDRDSRIAALLDLDRFWHYFGTFGKDRDQSRFEHLEKRLAGAMTPAARLLDLVSINRFAKKHADISGHTAKTLRGEAGLFVSGANTKASRHRRSAKREHKLGSLRYQLLNAATMKERIASLKKLVTFYETFGIFSGPERQRVQRMESHLKRGTPKEEESGLRKLLAYLTKHSAGVSGKTFNLLHPIGATAKTPKVDSSDQIANLRELLRQTNLRLAVSQAQYPAFGGSFASGGVVPGPRGAPRTIIAHGGEKVTPSGQTDVRVVIQDQRTRVFVDDREVRAIVKDETRRQARRANRPLAGRGGGRL